MIFGHGVSVQLSGTPIGWLLALSAPIATAYLLILQRRHPRPATQPHRRALMAMLLLQYLVFMTVHIYLGTQRVMYMYHYFLGLVLAFCLVPLVMQEAADRWPGFRDQQSRMLTTATVLLLMGFVFYSPLTFHSPLTHAQCERRNLLQHVVKCLP